MSYSVDRSAAASPPYLVHSRAAPGEAEGEARVDRQLSAHYKPPARWALAPLVEHAQVAQLVEHATENRSVGGSIPPLGTIPR
jgi:hypothetical protein